MRESCKKRRVWESIPNDKREKGREDEEEIKKKIIKWRKRERKKINPTDHTVVQK